MTTPPMTLNQAKKIVRTWLEVSGFQGMKVTARTVDFTDLARAKEIVVTVHGWKPHPEWAILKWEARSKGFQVEAA